MEKEDRTYEKKDLLLRSAQTEFLKYGYDKASLRNICRNADMTTGALYFFFKNKENSDYQVTRVNKQPLVSLGCGSMCQAGLGASTW